MAVGLLGWLACSEAAGPAPPGAATRVEVTPAGASILTVGGTTTFAAAAWDADSTSIPSPTVSWSSLNPVVATVDVTTGEVTGVSSGQATIAAEVDGIVGYALVTVSATGTSPVTSWTFEAEPRAHLYAVWGTSPNDVFAVGQWKTILHYDGTAWSPMEVDTTKICWDFKGVWGAGGDDVFAVGRCGTIAHYDGTSWTDMSSPTGWNLEGVWGASSDDVYAAGWSGTLVHYDGASWTVVPTGTDETLVAVWGTSADDVFVVGNGGTILHYDGAA
ncbi:MAG: Ig-like domain-containing protein, partial [Gemmatimonadota bacterium]